MADAPRSLDTLAMRLMTTGLLTDREARAARVTSDLELKSWIAGQGILPAKVVNQALKGESLQLGRYEILGRVGRGGMGAVLKASDSSLQRQVALKVLPQDAKHEELGRFRREAKALAALNHPNVVRIYSFEVESGVAFFVMQLVDGPSLEKRLSTGPPLDEDEGWRLLTHSVQALAHAEEHGILHRDVKPGNILCESDGKQITYRLCDFGLARFAKEQDGRITQAGFTMGTPAYMSPEQACGKEVDSRSDMFGLSLSMHQALTGKIPFEQDGGPIAVVLARRLTEDVPDVRQARPEISPELASILGSLSARDPKRRPASWKAVLGLLKARRKRDSGRHSPARRSVSDRQVAQRPAEARLPVGLIAVAVAVASIVAGVIGAGLSGGGDPVVATPRADAASVGTRASLAPGPTSDVAAASSAVAPRGASSKQPPAHPADEPVEAPSPDGPAEPKPPGEDAASKPAKAWELVTDAESYARALVAAEAGDPAAMHVVGVWLSKSQPAEAARWFRLAAEQGVASSMVLLGEALRLGYGVEASPEEASAWFRLAAERGDPAGMYAFAGELVSTDAARARRLIERAARAGHLPSMARYADYLELGVGAAPDAPEALAWFRKAAQAGDPRSLVRVGVLLLEGEGVTADPEEAARCFDAAAQAGVASAYTQLGVLTLEGRGVAKDEAAAAGFFAAAARRGDLNGMYRLGVALAGGVGVPRDPVKGGVWLKLAAEGGVPAGMLEWGNLLHRGLGIERDRALGVSWWRKAAELGDSLGMINLAWARENGEGIAQDDAEADRWYHASLEGGGEVAKRSLEEWDLLAHPQRVDGWQPAYPQRSERKGLKRNGGSAATERVVEAALEWLVRHQDLAGSWTVTGWARRCAPEASCKGPGQEPAPREDDLHYDVGLTALGLLAFLGQGHSHVGDGPYKPRVRRALRWLLQQQSEDGLIGFDPKRGGTLYNHALATLALCEAYGLTGDAQVRGPAVAALSACVEAQNPGLGWKYGLRSGENDTSMTGWMVQALSAGQVAGLPTGRSLSDARKWFQLATAGNGAAGYETPGGASAFLRESKGKFDGLPVMTAAAILGRLDCGVRKSDSLLRKGAKILLRHPPEMKQRKLNFYYWYYGSNALFRLNMAQFKRWNRDLKAVLLPSQRTVGCAAGSWDPLGEWCPVGGRVYATAINALSLETYYRRKR